MNFPGTFHRRRHGQFEFRTRDKTTRENFFTQQPSKYARFYPKPPQTSPRHGPERRRPRVDALYFWEIREEQIVAIVVTKVARAFQSGIDNKHEMKLSRVMFYILLFVSILFVLKNGKVVKE